jgi:hypothetical protein
MTGPVRTGEWPDGPPHVQALLEQVRRWRAG